MNPRTPIVPDRRAASLWPAVLPAFLLSACLMPPAGSRTLPVPYNPPAPTRPLTLRRVLRFEHRQVNASAHPADIEMFIAVPRDNERQKVRFFQAGPPVADELTDEYGNRILHYVDRGVPPGDVVAHGWMAEVEISSLVHDPLALRRGGRATLSPGARAVFLRDGESYQLTSPVVRELAEKLRARSGRAEETVRNIFEYLTENLRYARDDVWDPAPVILTRKTGSCSEYNYAFVALCRAAGIPARYTGGIVLSASRVTRYDPSTTEDAVFHRWSEVFLPGRGWFPVDCSRAAGERKRFGNPDNDYGRLPAGLLQCVRGDGLGGTPLGWDYLSNVKLPYREERDWAAKVGFWLAGEEPGALARRVAAVAARLKGRQDRALFGALLESSLDREVLFLFRNRIRPGAVADLVRALREAGHPGAVYWSLLATHRGWKVPDDLRYPALCGNGLREEIDKVYKPRSGGDLFTFEYWWRKARPKTRWDAKQGVFVLTSREINIY